MKINKMIDHTLLKPEATGAEITKLCAEAIEYDFASVCVNPYWVKTAHEQLKGSNVKVCTVVGFPLGATSIKAKSRETHYAIIDGADEIDMVLNIGAFKSGLTEQVYDDISAVVSEARGKVVKVILETCLLTKDEIAVACEICQDAGATFVKTSTGFSTGGATIEDVELMKKSAPKLEVKASGGVRSFDDAYKMIKAGATRIGTSNGVKIVKGEVVESGY